MAQLNLSIVTPSGSVVSADVSEVTVPGAAGMFTVYPEHQPALVMLGGGQLSYSGADGQGEVYIRGGVAEISADSILVMTDYAIVSEDTNLDDARNLLSEAERRLAESDYLDDTVLMRITVDQRFAESIISS